MDQSRSLPCNHTAVKNLYSIISDNLLHSKANNYFFYLSGNYNHITMKQIITTILTMTIVFDGFGQTLQSVTDAGNVTSNEIVVQGNSLTVASGPTTSGGYSGLQITPTGTNLNGGYTMINSFYSGIGWISPLVLQSHGMGKVGIGTTNPQSTLDVVGEVRSTNSGSNSYWAYMKANWAENNAFELGVSGHKLLTSDNYYYGSALNFWTSDANQMTINTSGNVGIGTSTPETGLEIAKPHAVIRLSGAHSEGLQFYRSGAQSWNLTSLANSRDIAFYNHGGTNAYDFTIKHNNGNVGIGTTTPGAKQEIYLANGGMNQFRLSTGFSGGNYIDINPFITGVNNGGFAISQNGSIRFVIDNSGDGNVGIGTTSPQGYKLAVAGKVRATEIKVEALPWSDFVFESSYKLRDLKDTEQFIKENKHLPEIPSAAEVEKDGINVGEMSAKLLQKIEELTLYMIDFNKKMEVIQKENQTLRVKVAQLEANQ